MLTVWLVIITSPFWVRATIDLIVTIGEYRTLRKSSPFVTRTAAWRSAR